MVGAMGKYSRLGEFLQAQRHKEIRMTFAEIERVIGSKLPPNSPQYPAWWSNNPSNNVMTKVWLDAGYESTQVDLHARRLVFRRIAKPANSTEGSPRPPRKGECHPIFGALKDVTFIPPGVDLTEPADPEWGKVYDD